MSSQQATQAAQDSLHGVLERIIYFNEENHYCIGEFRENKTRKTFTITGALPAVQCGETLLLKGTWNHHPQHGEQFKVAEFESKLPSTVHGIRKYLGSGLVPGIGKVYANKIVDHFKADTLRVISEESARLREIPGIGAGRAHAIKEAWDSQQAFRDVFMFLKTYGVSTAQCLRLVKKYGNTAIKILKNEPYRLVDDIDGIGFKTADKIALNLGLPNDSDARINAGILYLLSEFASDGHTACLVEELTQKATELLETDIDKVKDRIIYLMSVQELIPLNNPDLVQLATYHQAEETSAQCIGKIANAPSSLPSIILDKAIEWAQERAGFEFAPEQKNAIETALSSKVSVITGGPGTGKTTILRALTDILRAKKARVLLAAPTGRASQRMSEATNCSAQTIHRLLKIDPSSRSFVHKENNPLPTDFLVVDEASMIDTKLARALFRAIPPTAHLVLVGDVHQLPSVGAGSILNDIIRNKKIASIALNKIFRQSDVSNIVGTAHGILAGNGSAPALVDNVGQIDRDHDLHFLRATSPEECLQKIIQLSTSYLPKNYHVDPLMDVQVLAPLHKGIAGIFNINQELQKSLNASGKKIPHGINRFKIGDKVLQTRNNYDKNIFNGDLGKIISHNPENSTIKVDFDGNVVELENVEATDLTLAYSISIHKSQGSEFPIVIIPLLKQHFIMLKRNLIYTAITRGRKKVFIVGDPIAYAMAVKNVDSTTRLTGLPEKLNKALA